MQNLTYQGSSIVKFYYRGFSTLGVVEITRGVETIETLYLKVVETTSKS